MALARGARVRRTSFSEQLKSVVETYGSVANVMENGLAPLTSGGKVPNLAIGGTGGGGGAGGAFCSRLAMAGSSGNVVVAGWVGFPPTGTTIVCSFCCRACLVLSAATTPFRGFAPVTLAAPLRSLSTTLCFVAAIVNTGSTTLTVTSSTLICSGVPVADVAQRRVPFWRYIASPFRGLTVRIPGSGPTPRMLQ